MGSGKRDADEIKEHPFMANVNWTDAINKKLKVPKPYVKKVTKQDIPLEKIFGRGAFDEGMKG